MLTLKQVLEDMVDESFLNDNWKSDKKDQGFSEEEFFLIDKYINGLKLVYSFLETFNTGDCLVITVVNGSNTEIYKVTNIKTGYKINNNYDQEIMCSHIISLLEFIHDTGYTYTRYITNVSHI